MRIFITKSGRQLGPFSMEDIRRQVQAGTLEATDWAWYEGQTDWVPLNQVPGFTMPEPIVRPAASLPPPPPPLRNPVGTMPDVHSPVGARPLGGTTSKLAIAAVVCGFAGIFCGITMIPAVILGHLALNEMKSHPEMSGRGMAITSLVIGYLWLLIVVLSVIIALSNQVAHPH